MHNKNYCPLIYKGLYIEKFNDLQAKISACCVNQSKVYNLLDFKDNHHLNRQRQLNNSGAHNIECSNCWEKESFGGWSIRNNMNEWFAENNLLEQPTKVELISLDYNTDPVCNAQCIMCGPNYSSAWAAEVGVARYVSATKKNTLINNVDLSQLRRIYFNGGEPLLTTDHIDVLKSIPNLSQVEISYNTNGSQWPSDETLGLWAQAKNVTVNFSIDGTERVFEYTRYPLKWPNVSSNVFRMLTILPNVYIGLSYVAGIHNLLDIYKTQSWWHQTTSFSPRPTRFSVHPVYGILGIENASPSLKTIFKNYLADDQSEWAQQLKTMLNVTSFNDQWIDHLNKIDQRRGLNWQQWLQNLATVCANH